MNKKRVFLLFMLVFSINLVSAINLEINKEAVNDVIIAEINNPAVFNFTIKNLGQTDNFEIYSLVGVDISPKGTFSIKTGETKQIEVKVYAEDSIKRNSGYITFVYQIKGGNTGIQEDKLTIKIVRLKDAFEFSAGDIVPSSDKVIAYFHNKENFNFEKIDAKFSSVFFEADESFSLASFEKKAFEIPLDKEKIKNLLAGPYLLNADILVDGAKETIESTIRFLEKEGLVTETKKEGFIIRREEIIKRNEGNVQILAETSVNRNIISRLFTTASPSPDRVERTGLLITYRWQKELRPADSLDVIAKTNWIIPIAAIIIIILIIIFSKIYLVSDLILHKKIGLVKTKGGEFALKITINLKAKKFIERINIIDKLPPIVKIYERYGSVSPERIDEKNKRIEWNIESLNEGEERILSYIVYSKIGVIGKFELPPTRAVYERNGRIKETSSNKVFFLNEPHRIEKEKFKD